ncbi:MAG TPA: hypothetical protein VIH05_10380 [Tepidiformaceae bacterium]
MRVLHRRLTLAGAVVALLMVVGVGTALPEAQASNRESPIVQVALPYNGTYQGECWIWVKKVVLEATGRQMGYDYREGFFEAGAVEVSAEDARPGDIIQLISDAYTSPWADYPGMHTAIVLENHGQGRFTVIDSNSRWDGVVRIRSNFLPAAAAARHGIQYHIYRIDPEAEQAAQQFVEIDEWWLDPVDTGDVVRITSEEGCVSLRASSGPGSDVQACLPDGLLVLVTGQPVKGAGRTWLPVEVGPLRGWVSWSRVTPQPGGTTVAMSEFMKLFWVVPRAALGR